MVRTVVSEGFLLTRAPRVCSSVICVLKTDHMINVNEVTGFIGVEAYGGIGFVTTVVKVFAIVVVCTGQ